MSWCCWLQRLRECGFIWNFSPTAWQPSLSAIFVSLDGEEDRTGFFVSFSYFELWELTDKKEICEGSEKKSVGLGIYSESDLNACRELYSNNISGVIPPELGNLTQLVSLDLYLNNFSGSIPDTLGQLLELRFLWVSQVPHFAQSSGLKPVSFPVIQWVQICPMKRYVLNCEGMQDEIPLG